MLKSKTLQIKASVSATGPNNRGQKIFFPAHILQKVHIKDYRDNCFENIFINMESIYNRITLRVRDYPEWKQLGLLFLLCLILFAPFSGKAFSIDSPVTVYMAKQLSVNMLDPPLDDSGQIFAQWNYTRMPPTSAFRITPHPPLVPWLLTPIIKIFGENEIVLNWVLFVFYLLAVFFFYRIAGLILPGYQLPVTLLFMLCPAVFTNVTRVMLDLPLTVFMMGSFFHMFRSPKASDAVFAGLYAGLACLTKATGGTMFFTAVLFYTWNRQWRQMLYFLIPFLLLNGMWGAHNLIIWGKLQLFSTGHAKYSLGDIRYRVERFLSYLGGGFVFPALLFGLAFMKKRTRMVLLSGLFLTTVFSVLLWKKLNYLPIDAMFYAFYSSAGIFILYVGVDFMRGKKCSIQKKVLFLHFTLQVIGGFFLTSYTLRYLLPVAFVVILILSQVIIFNVRPKRISAVFITTVLTSAAVSLILSIGNFQIAEAQRRVARDLTQHYPGKKIFYNGRLGYLYYMRKAGFHNLYYTPEKPKPGDLMVRNYFPPTKDDDRFFLSGTYNLKKVREFQYPLLVMAMRGTTENYLGYTRLPYALRLPAGPRRFLVYEVQ